MASTLNHMYLHDHDPIQSTHCNNGSSIAIISQRINKHHKPQHSYLHYNLNGVNYQYNLWKVTLNSITFLELIFVCTKTLIHIFAVLFCLSLLFWYYWHKLNRMTSHCSGRMSSYSSSCITLPELRHASYGPQAARNRIAG